jgi:hypothetical protein
MPDECKSLEAKTGQVFAWAGESACNAASCGATHAFLEKTSLVDQHALLYPTASCVGDWLAHYAKLKDQAPSRVSSCWIVPKFLRQKWRTALNGMELLRTYRRGTQVFLQDGKATAMPWDVEVWYDRPRPKLQLGIAMRHALTWQFVAQARGQKVSVLVDTGASDVFVSRRTCTELNITVKQASTPQSVSLGDGQADAVVCGTCTLPIRMQGYRGAVQAFVLESILEGFDVVLGDAWMRQHSVTLNYRARRMELRKGKRYLSLAPSDLTAQASGAKEHRLVSVAAIRRALRKGDGAQHAFLVVVTAAGGNTTMQAPASGLGEAGVLMTQTRLDSILQEYADVMPDDLPAGLPPERGVGHTIPLLADNLKPPNRPLYRLSPLEMEEVKRQVADCWQRGSLSLARATMAQAFCS